MTVLGRVDDLDTGVAHRDGRLFKIAVAVIEADGVLPRPFAERPRLHFPQIAVADVGRPGGDRLHQRAVNDPRLAVAADGNLGHAAVRQHVAGRGDDLLARLAGDADGVA